MAKRVGVRTPMSVAFGAFVLSRVGECGSSHNNGLRATPALLACIACACVRLPVAAEESKFFSFLAEGTCLGSTPAALRICSMRLFFPQRHNRPGRTRQMRTGTFFAATVRVTFVMKSSLLLGLSEGSAEGAALRQYSEKEHSL